MGLLNSKIHIPLFGKKRRVATQEEEMANIINNDTKFNVKEAYKTTRTNMIFALNSEKSCNRIILTSSIPGEGKSLTSLNVAITFAMAENKVLIIDCDLRKSRVHRYLGLERRNGLSNVICGYLGLDEAIKKNVRPNLDCITAGEIPPNPAEPGNTKGVPFGTPFVMFEFHTQKQKNVSF